MGLESLKWFSWPGTDINESFTSKNLFNTSAYSDSYNLGRNYMQLLTYVPKLNLRTGTFTFLRNVGTYLPCNRVTNSAKTLNLERYVRKTCHV
jgi:hypothetical protein